MKRVCTLRKSYFFSFKGPLRKVIFLSFLNIVAFYRHSVLIVFEISPAGRFFMLQYISIFFETCKFLSIFFQKKANFLMFFIK